MARRVKTPHSGNPKVSFTYTISVSELIGTDPAQIQSAIATGGYKVLLRKLASREVDDGGEPAQPQTD